MKAMFFILIAFVLAACTSVHKSAYQSGWNNNSSENTYKECAMVWLDKDMFIQQNLNRLVQLNLLSNDEAGRVKEADLRSGDSECLVYATYGLNHSKVTFFMNKDKQLISKTVHYSCQNSRVKCPGSEITIINGRVSNIKELTN